MLYLDAVLVSRLMRFAYGLAAIVGFVLLWATAVPADESLLPKAALVVCSAVITVVCGWMAVAPKQERRRIGFRTAGVMVGGVSCGLTIAGLGAFDVPRREFGPPGEIASLDVTGSVLASAGFRDASVVYPKTMPETILVRYSGGPSLDQPDAAGRAAEIVWTHEAVRFRTLTIQANGASASFSYDELADLFGPRPSGFDNFTIADLRGAWHHGP